ncbi:hypothetical protein FPANT_11894 [Fusarium pseudoanthophilum]|uniref:Uncharacterized protein n=1 Tax=Fusarium pseudoanthophilum TaxID=48495 RepID=A0A8H5KL41_9HYPO|nr:hypothetical protein FPANT_11894 [Fusarium pseudoanthophilum]
MPEPLESDPPLIDKDDPECLSPAALRLADDKPHEFIDYLHRVWDTNREQFRVSSKLLHQLRQVKVPCHDGHLHPISKTWIRTTNFMRICSKFLLPEEPFRFVILNDQDFKDEDSDSWSFLWEIGCQYKLGDQFLTDLLLTIKEASPTNVKDPERVFGIYACFRPRSKYGMPYNSIHYKFLSDDENRHNFNAGELLLHKGKWIKPSSCFNRAPEYVRSKIVLTPVSAGTDASSSEPLSKSDFYQLILGIPDFPKVWHSIFSGLNALQKSTGQTSIQPMAELYRALNESLETRNLPQNERQLREQERTAMPRLFQQLEMIAVPQGSVIKWQTQLTCIWSPLMKIRNLAELSRLYPDLKDFFVGLLGVEEATEKTVLSRMSDDTPEFEMRDLFSLLNCLIKTSQISIKPDEILPRRVFLGKRNGKNHRFVGTEEFFIPDDQEFATTFKDDLPLLDVTAEEIAILNPLFTWLGFQDRYLSNRVSHRCIWCPCAQQQKLEWDVVERAEGILRIAMHCGSPRTTTNRDKVALINILRDAEVLAVEGIKSQKVLLTRGKNSRCLGTGPHRHNGFAAPSPLPKLFIPFHDAKHPVRKLVIYVSPDKEERQLAVIAALPQRLMQWLMADPKTLTWGDHHERGVSLLKKVLAAPPKAIDALLASEGVKTIQIRMANRRKLHQEATLQNTTSNEPAHRPFLLGHDFSPSSGVLFDFSAHRNGFANAPRASSLTETLEKVQLASLFIFTQLPKPVAGPSSTMVSQEATPQANQHESTSGRQTESSSGDMKKPLKDEPVPSGDEDEYTPRYASISERPKLKPMSRKRSRSPSSNSPPSSHLSQLPDDVMRGIERLSIADTSEVTLQSPNLISVA